MPVVTTVNGLDFQHVFRFLSSLGEERQNAFGMREDGTAGRKLIIELQGPYTTACVPKLRKWIEQVQSFTGPGKHGELATVHRALGDDPRPMRVSFVLKLMATLQSGGCQSQPGCDRFPVFREVQAYRKQIAPGSGDNELCKILKVLYARFRQEVWLHEKEHEEILEAVTGRWWYF